MTTTAASPAAADRGENASVVFLITSVVAAAAVALALTARTTWTAVDGRPGGFLTFAALTAALALVAVHVYDRGSFDFSGSGVLAAGLAFGAGVAMVVALVATAVHFARLRGKPHRAAFTGGTLALAAAAGILPSSLAHAGSQALWARVAFAAIAGPLYGAINVGLLSVAMGLSEGRGARTVFNERFRWMAPYYGVSGVLALALVIADERTGPLGLFAFATPPLFMMVSVRQYLRRTASSVEDVRRANDELAAKNRDLHEMTDRLRRTHLATIAALSRSMEAKDFYTGGHTERVAAIAVALAERLGFDEEELEAIEVGGLLHDIGKIGIPESILRKPDALDDDEWAVMREHPLISDRILASIDLPPIVRQIARSSHERIDGLGYPDRLAGDEIPLAARIVFVADAFDALTSDRPYRRRRSTVAALDEIRDHAGTQFCPRVVAALDELSRERPDILTASYLAAVA